MASVSAVDLTKETLDTALRRSIPQLSTRLNNTHLNANDVNDRRSSQTSLLSRAKITKRKATFDAESANHLYKDRCLNATKGNVVNSLSLDQNRKRPRTSSVCSSPLPGVSQIEISTLFDISDDETVVGDVSAESDEIRTDFCILPCDQDIQIVQTVDRRPSNTSSVSTQIDKIRTVNCTCAPGKSVELMDGNFIRINAMYRDNQNVVWIVGQLFTRHDYLDGHRWSRRHNEVVLQSTITKGQDTEFTQRQLSDVRRNRHLIVTNDSFPRTSIYDNDNAWPSRRENIELGPLFCRWKQTKVLDDARKVVEESIEKIRLEEADPKFRVDSGKIRRRWRGGPTDLGGSQNISTHPLRSSDELQKTQRYTFGDAFCGAGGASCGADEAGLQVKFGVDLSQNAMKTYKLNFFKKGTDCHPQDIFDFIQIAGRYTRRVDVLHISPPCQPFSPAHTIESQRRDETNQAALFAVGALIKCIKPRVVTLEETFGLLSRHQEWFDALVKEFVDMGYSIRWANVRLEDYGLPQKRRRLLIIAAGPGEILPPFPASTNSETDENLPRLKTIHDAISAIPPGTPNHNTLAVRYQAGDERSPYSEHTQAKTITCSGGQGNHHPSGKRAYTMRELAALQRFPPSYQFADLGVTELRRQIGNAVPPYTFKKVMREVVKSLKESDRKEKLNMK